LGSTLQSFAKPAATRRATDGNAAGQPERGSLSLFPKANVACTPHGKDRYGRTLAVCSAGDIPDVGEVLVREGYAVNFALSSNGYPAAERDAQSARRGLWQGEFERPQDWRRRHPRAE
jgi:endonuclease YncB( thermonuclease family)